MRGLLLLLLLAAVPLTAQPFRSLDVSAEPHVDVHRGLFQQYWTAAEGGLLTLRTPFYLGYVELGGGAHRFDPVTPEVPDFHALMVLAGWGLDGQVRRLGASAGVRIGNYRMTFDDDTFRGWQTESELLLGATARVQVRLVRGLHVFGTGSYMKTFTYIRLQQVLVGGGLALQVQTPGWLKPVLE